MPVTSPSDRAPGRSRAATRNRILASGTALFARRGLHEVTSHDIASEAGVAAGTFYLHFPDKQTLFREIAAEICANAPLAVQEITRAAKVYLESGEAAAIAEIPTMRKRTAGSKDFVEGIASFREKRPARA